MRPHVKPFVKVTLCCVSSLFRPTSFGWLSIRKLPGLIHRIPGTGMTPSGISLSSGANSFTATTVKFIPEDHAEVTPRDPRPHIPQVVSGQQRRSVVEDIPVQRQFQRRRVFQPQSLTILVRDHRAPGLAEVPADTQIWNHSPSPVHRSVGFTFVAPLGPSCTGVICASAAPGA